MDFITILGVIFLVVIVGFVIKHIGSALLGAGKSLGIILLGAIGRGILVWMRNNNSPRRL